MVSLRKYNKAGGKVLRGLDNRRKDEEALFMRA
jgi:GH24 family phage-related lysozyme (muramidase)